jgi:hypothetical protein
LGVHEWSSSSPLHKCTVAMLMLAYGTPADMWDKNFRIGETTIIECMKKNLSRCDCKFW